MGSWLLSLPVSETDTDIVALGETTESTRQLPLLLDKLKCPTKSDLCRKRTVQSLKPTAVKKRHQPGTSNPTDLKSVTAHSRVKEFPNEYLIVRNSNFFVVHAEKKSLKKRVPSLTTFSLEGNTRKPQRH